MSLLVATRRALLNVGGVTYLLRDEFDDTVAAGAVNGTLATDGVNTRTVTDTNSKLSIGSGVASFATGGVGIRDPVISYGGITRTSGRYCVVQPKIASEGTFSGLTDGIAQSRRAMFRFTSTNLGVYPGAALIIVGSYSTSTNYVVCVVLRTSGVYFFVKGGAFTNWTLLYADDTSTISTLYPMIAAEDSTSAFTSDYIRIPDRIFIPPVALYDTFTRANGALGDSETVGPDSQAVTARTWESGGSTWAIASNEAVNTPTVGSELWDGPAAAFTSGTYAWTVYGTNTIANVANRLQITYVDNAAGAYVNLKDASDLSSDLTIGAWYQFTCDADMDAGDTARIRVYDGAAYQATTAPVTDAGASVVLTFYAEHATNALVNLTQLGAGEIAYLDNLSLKAITLNTLFTDVDDGATSDYLAEVECDTLNAGVQAGMVLNLDDKDTPANFVIALHDKVTAKLIKCVAGTYTSVISATATYAVGAKLVVIKEGTSYQLFYNNAKVGSTSTISDAGIISNTKHGLFSTSASDQLDNFAVFYRTHADYDTEFDNV